MVELDSFLSEEMMTAPEHPLADKMELPLPNSQQASLEEIRAIQRRDHIPGVVKRMIPLEANALWEYWWCVPGRLLLPEDIQLLESDRPRVEAIVSKLVWLWGGICFGKETIRPQDCAPVYDWQQVLAFVHQQGFKPDLLDIDYLPMAVRLDRRHSNSMLDSSAPSHVAVEPPHWHIEFFQMQPTEGGCELQEPKTICSCQIWTSKPFIKHLETGEVKTRYDLWVSQPLDLTNPPWRSPLVSKQP
ncbi:hypothetical protein [Chroococcidiopsis sp. CCMEE 29]|uniref:hypothetical protein n=1 Tax=Chroococcidiopsis sp. CCMEE 29 TaxID=155894 RepID=UPI0020203147|nr:hypothetical protein [Chroococcidiopsis sp. CCMEE 29]